RTENGVTASAHLCDKELDLGIEPFKRIACGDAGSWLGSGLWYHFWTAEQKREAIMRPRMPVGGNLKTGAPRTEPQRSVREMRNVIHHAQVVRVTRHVGHLNQHLSVRLQPLVKCAEHVRGLGNMFQRVPDDDEVKVRPWQLRGVAAGEAHDARESQDLLTKLVGDVQRLKLPVGKSLP